MSVTPDTLRLISAARSALDTRLQLQATRLTGLWVTAWNDVSSDLDRALLELMMTAQSDTITRALMLRSSRLVNALRVISTHLESLSAEAQTTVTGGLSAVVDEAGRAQAAIVGSQLPAGAVVDYGGWDRVSTAAVQAIVDRANGNVVSAMRPLAPQAYAALRAEIVRGVTIGDNPRVTAARMLQRAGYQFNGGLTRALTVSRTESIDAHRAASALSQQQHTDVLDGWRWLSALDGRTCPACWALSGSEHPLTEPGPLGHQNCRCSRVPVTRSWADLGFDVVEPASSFPDSEAIFAGLPAYQQKAILGPVRFEAWKAGQFPVSEWAARRSNTGWRDSYVASSPGNGRSVPAAA